MADIYKNYDIFTSSIEDAVYPEILKKMKDMPRLLYYKGDIKILNQAKSVAVIGSRQASENGLRLAYETGAEVAGKGFNLVNGLALGCDAAAVRGALSVNGKCVAVLPGGLSQIQPKANLNLAEEILEKGGCLLSEYPSSMNPQKHTYVERDRIQSGLSHGVLIIEAERNSGTVHTADFANRQQKRLACYHYKILDLASGNRYLEEKKRADIIRSKKDLLSFLSEIEVETVCEQISFM